MEINPDTTLLDDAIDEIADLSQHLPEPRGFREKRKLLVEIREKANDALLAFADVEHRAILAAADA